MCELETAETTGISSGMISSVGGGHPPHAGPLMTGCEAFTCAALHHIARGRSQ